MSTRRIDSQRGEPASAIQVNELTSRKRRNSRRPPTDNGRLKIMRNWIVAALLIVLGQPGAYAQPAPKPDRPQEIAVVENMIDAQALFSTVTCSPRTASPFDDERAGHQSRVRAARFYAGIQSITLCVRHIGRIGDVVFMNASTNSVYKAIPAVPVVGVLFIEDGASS
jgi:hypothetical protein